MGISRGGHVPLVPPFPTPLRPVVCSDGGTYTVPQDVQPRHRLVKFSDDTYTQRALNIRTYLTVPDGNADAHSANLRGYTVSAIRIGGFYTFGEWLTGALCFACFTNDANVS